MAKKGIAPRDTDQRGSTTAESVPAERRGTLTTPEPPAETLFGGVDRDGSSRYRGHKRQAVTLCLLTTRGFPPIRVGVRASRLSPRPHFGPSALFATAQRFLQAGWNRGVLLRFTPEIYQG